MAGLLHLGALALCATGIALGVRCCTCCYVFAILYAYFVLCERTMFNNPYYLYILIALLLANSDVCHTFAMDERVKNHRMPRPRAWQLWLLRCQVQCGPTPTPVHT